MTAHNAFQSATDQFTNAVVHKLISLLNPAKILDEFSKASCYFGLFLLPVAAPIFASILRQLGRVKKESVFALLGTMLLSVFPLAHLMIVRAKHMPFNQNLFLPPYIGTYSIIGGEAT